MASKNPLGKIKDVAAVSLKPVAVAGSAVGSAVDLARSATGSATGVITSLVGRKGAAPAEKTAEEPADKPGDKRAEETAGTSTEEKPAAEKPAAKKAPAKKAPAKKAPATKAAAKKAPAKRSAAKPVDPEPPAAVVEKAASTPPEPVNVTEELGLDPAPVEKPKSATTQADKPVTAIDAQADASDVDVTPADVAQAVSKDGSGPAGPA